MKLHYNLLLLALLAGGLLWPGQARAQSYAGDYTTCPTDQAECVVEYLYDSAVGVNALRLTIANDTDRPDDRVYVLKRGGFYWITDPIQNEGFHLRIAGETEEVVPDGETDFGPAIIQRYSREDGSTPAGTMFESNADLTVRNVWLMGQTDQGGLTSYEPIKLLGDGSTYVFDNVIFDRNDWHHLGPDAANTTFIVTNSIFRNLLGPTQQWEGLGIRFEAGADSVVFENNTFFNIAFTPFQSESAPMDYFRANHNTFVNIGRTFQAGAMWKNAYITNNLFVNPFWMGESESQYTDPAREDPYSGFFSIAAMPARFGTDFDRQILLANNGWWRDSYFEDWYANNDTIRAQPFVNDTTEGWFAQYENMVMQNNIDGEQPNFANAPVGDTDLYAQMQNHILTIWAGNTIEDRADLWYWDPGRDLEDYDLNIWPLPEDFSYTNSDLMIAGTDDLPLGDLNWFPDAKTDYLQNREQYIEEIESMTGEPPVLNVVAAAEAEDGVLGDNADEYVPDGFMHYFMEGSGYIEWTFNLATEGTYGIDLHTNMRTETQRGQNVRVDGVNLRNADGYGEYYFCTASIDGCANPLPTEQWTTVEIRSDGLVEGAEGLTMSAGEHTVRITPSWGWQGFSGIDIVDGTGAVVAELTAADAVAEGVQEMCDDASYCPQSFGAVELNANGTVTWNMEVPRNGRYMVRAFYAAGSDGTAEVSADGTPVSSISFTGGDTTNVFTDLFDLTSGVVPIQLSSSTGGITVDHVQLIEFVPAASGVEENELPEGYALHQNYPNPFNPSTTIRYEMGAPGSVRLDVFDVLGRQVATLVDGRVSAGPHSVQFDARSLASGLYFYRIETPVGMQTRKMVLVK